MTKLTWTTIQYRLGDLLEYEKNPVQISERDAKELARSLEKFEHVLPYVAAAPKNSRKGLPLLDGHQRKMVELSLRKVSPDTMVDVRVPSRPLKDKEKQELVVRLRKNTGEFDFDKLANYFDVPDLLDWGFSEKELQLGGFEFPDESKDAEPQIDRAEELLKKWKVRLGDMFQIGEHRLICGDCTDAATVDRVMGGERARMIFTDPPWNVAIGKDSNPRHKQRWGLQNDDMTDDDYASFVEAFVRSFSSVCSGDIYCKVASEYMDIIGGIFRSNKFHWSATVIWVKDIFVLGRSKYHRRYEPMWYGWHKSGKSSFCDARDLDDVWEIKRPRVSDEHPTMMPIELPERAIRNSSVDGDVVYEPFGGSGTTMVACNNLGRKCRMIEIDPKYCAVILERMSQAFPELSIKRVK